jgi:hypothetical protein
VEQEEKKNEDESKNTVKKINEVPEDVLRKILEE